MLLRIHRRSNLPSRLLLSSLSKVAGITTSNDNSSATTVFTEARRHYYQEGGSKNSSNNNNRGSKRRDWDSDSRGPRYSKHYNNNNDRGSSNSGYFNTKNYGGNRGGRSSGGRGGSSSRQYPPRRYDTMEDAEPTLETNSKFTKKVVRLDSTNNNEEVTLDQLHEEGIIDTMLHKSISRMGFPGLSPVQQRTIKPILSSTTNDDVIARAKTGTGKTFAFLIPMFQHLINTQLDSRYMVKCVIVAPTRDLALQIEAEVKKIHDHNYGLKKFGCVSLVGGTNFGMAMRRMDQIRPNIVIATPGRLIDVLQKYGNKFFKYVDFKILDEADRLLEIGFKEDLEFVSGYLNDINAKAKDHIRTLLFSATLDEKVQVLANEIMNKDQCLFLDTVDKNEPEAHEKIDQAVVVTNHFAESVYATLDHLQKQIVADPGYKGILFAPTVKFTRFIAKLLQKEFTNDLPVLEFHGQLDQRRRTNLVNNFKKMEKGLLVCTDVGARGMDFPNVKEVLQVGVPSELPNYIHRIGRTARSGKEGSSTLFICKDELPFIDRLKFEKNIIIENSRDFQPDEEMRTEFAKKIEENSSLGFGEVLISVISFYRSCIKEYGFRERDILPEIASSYAVLLNKPDAKIPVESFSFLEKMGLARNGRVRDMFEVKPRNYDEEGDGNDEFNGEDNDSFGDGGNYRYNNNNRRGNYGHSNNRRNNYNSNRRRTYDNNNSFE
ncbi:ATP-dependent RNA helicase NDAI_0C04680 [Naumovozyma dairenensis CBS 421]|uniref:ATP-dependent RNA helicase n=1 Tax=Naumovozyma dairenensis (strain ATCC 10597 / BCRC 20456 / CBS 421 / NBRC 0211 / NRRL Y-12639) TaxID=1071378 RepID=G0W8L6_NAUDC|nr:hypothetical protein NDAI_0C04680 [Naumovozyma dairenensis CBS 421]CCD24127.1 hypothetical protein NDAI_0C04680 [Naumovozyma dairenensis CBS 421]